MRIHHHSSLLLRGVFIFIVFLSFDSFAQKVSEITVSGNQRIEKQAILKKIGNRVGKKFIFSKVTQDVKNLMSTKQFLNVEVFREVLGDQVSLNYKVTEKPVVVNYEFVGNSKKSDEDLLDVLDLKPYEFLEFGRLGNAVEEIKKFYEDKGYFLADVDFEVVPVKKGESVKVVFNVTENARVKVKKINFVGNSKIATEKIKGLLMTKEAMFFSFMTGSGDYKRDAFLRDLQVINFLYLDEGYLDVKVSPIDFSFSSDKKFIFLTVKIEEGDKYKVDDVNFAGDVLFTHEELLKDIGIDDKEYFSWSQIQRDIQVLQAKLGDLGYAYANVVPQNKPNKENNTVQLIFDFEKGQKVYFGDISITGNYRTRDKVVRRELEILEGELYNETLKRESLSNIKRLGFFEEVNFNTSVSENNSNIMNVEIEVKERNTGSIQLTAGYSSFQKFTLGGQLSQSNFLGKGQNLALSMQWSDREQLFSLNFTEPHFRDSDWSLGFEGYKSKRLRIEYDEEKVGGAIRVGHPLGKYFRTYLRYRLDETEINMDPSYEDPAIFPVNTVNGTTSSLTWGLIFDKRNDRFSATKGLFAQTSIEYAGVGGDIDFTKFESNFRYFKDIFWKFVFRNNLSYGLIRSNSSGEPPFNELYRLGGPYSLRGFTYGSVGKRVFSQKREADLIAAGFSAAVAKNSALVVFGGKQKLVYSAELEFPLIEEAKIKGVMFFDIGDSDDKINFSNFRSDIGFGFRWLSPMGPLRFEWGFPLDRKKELNEASSNFEFSIGSPF